MNEFATDRHRHQDYLHGIRHNQAQFIYQLLQVLLVGLTLGMMRTVVPALASSEFGVPKGLFMLLIAFVVAFGFVKGALNFVAGRLSEKIGRKKVLLIGWLFALPIPIMIMFAPSWGWIVAATVLLGVNQGAGVTAAWPRCARPGWSKNLSMRWSGCFTRYFCTSKASACPTSAGSSASMVLSGAPRNRSPASCQTASAATAPTCGACGFAVPASP